MDILSIYYQIPTVSHMDLVRNSLNHDMACNSTKFLWNIPASAIHSPDMLTWKVRSKQNAVRNISSNKNYRTEHVIFKVTQQCNYGRKLRVIAVTMFGPQLYHWHFSMCVCMYACVCVCVCVCVSFMYACVNVHATRNKKKMIIYKWEWLFV